MEQHETRRAMDFPPPTQSQARIIWMAVTGAAVALILALLVGLVWGLGRILSVLSPVLWPLAVAGVIAYDALQTIEGLVVSPRIMGDRVGLHPLTIIIAVIAGTTLLGGLLGGILAIPLTAALRVLMFRYVWKAPAG